MLKKFIPLMIASAALLAACSAVNDTSPTEVPATDHPTAEPTVTPTTGESNTGLPNPASVYCEGQGYTLEIRTDEDGGQVGVCLFDDGSECEEWAYYRGECHPASNEPVRGPSPTPEPITVQGWLGYVVSVPDDIIADRLVLLPEGTGELRLAGDLPPAINVINRLRDEEPPGTPANFWGRMACEGTGPDECFLFASTPRTGRQITGPEAVEEWQGTLHSNDEGAEYDDFFELSGPFPVRYGISPAAAQNGDAEVSAALDALRDTGKVFSVWGMLSCGVPDVNACQIAVQKVEAGGTVAALTPITPTPDADGLLTYTNPGYGFAFDYPEDWQISDYPGLIRLQKGTLLALIAYRTPDELWGSLWTGMPNGDSIEAGTVPFMNSGLDKTLLVDAGKTKVVSYWSMEDDTTSPVQLIIRLDDIPEGDYDYVDVEVSDTAVAEFESILASFRSYP